MRVWHARHVPAAALPELHSQDHQQPAGLSRVGRRHHDDDGQLLSAAGQKAVIGGGGFDSVFDLEKKEQQLTTITFIVTFFATNIFFL